TVIPICALQIKFMHQIIKAYIAGTVALCAIIERNFDAYLLSCFTPKVKPSVLHAKRRDKGYKRFDYRIGCRKCFAQMKIYIAIIPSGTYKYFPFSGKCICRLTEQ